MNRVSQLVTQVNPTFYDSESTSAATYESWMENGLAYYTANVEAATRIVPVLPSYSANRWHHPAVENIETASAAARVGLEQAAASTASGSGRAGAFCSMRKAPTTRAPTARAGSASTLALPFSP